jgi:hypothetical protein
VKLDPGTHKGAHSVLSSKLVVTRWDAAAAAGAVRSDNGARRGKCDGGSPNGVSPPPFLRVWHCRRDGMWSGRRVVDGVTLVESTLGVALMNIEDTVDDLLMGEVHVVGGHRPCELPWQCVRMGCHWSGGCGEGW